MTEAAPETTTRAPLVVGSLRVVPIDGIEPNDWNPNRQSDFKFQKELESIREFGFLDPVTVRSGRPGEPFAKPQIIDGEHRWRAGRELGMTEIQINDLGEVSDARARVLTDLMNNLRGETDRLVWVEMIEQVLASDESDLINLLPYPQEEVEELLKSTTFNWDELPDSDPNQTDADGKLYKKLTIALTESQHKLAKDVLRKVKATAATDSDGVALEIVLKAYKARHKGTNGRSGSGEP